MTSQPRAETPGGRPPPGLDVDGYRLLTRIGEGGMGVVHLAQRPGGARVALKVLRPHIIGDDEARQRLAREVGSLRRIRSRWVAEIVDADPWGDIPYVATRYVPGLSLHDQVREEGPIGGDDLAFLAASLAEGLQDVHAYGVLHRDVKPSNVLLEGRAPILIDFGLARVADDPRLTHAGWLLGTPGYLAPELLYGEDATTASDVHAWGATVAYAALGRPPFGTGPGMAIMDRVRRGEHRLDGSPSWLRPILVEAMSPDPLWRPTLEEIVALVREPGRSATASTASPVPTVAPSPAEDVFTAPLALAALAHTRDVTETFTETVTEAPARREQFDHAGHPQPPYLQSFPPQTYHAGEPYDPYAAPPRPPLPVRLRRSALFGALTFAGGAAIAAAPYLAAAVMFVGAWLLRSGSLAASAASLRRQLRGARRWYDAPQLLVATPWHLLQALAGTFLLVLWALGLATAGGLIAYALSLGLSEGLLLSGVLFTAGLLLGPGGRRVRGPIGRVAGPLAERNLATGIGVLVILTGVILLLVAATGGPSWSPGSDHPFAGLSLHSVLPSFGR